MSVLQIPRHVLALQNTFGLATLFVSYRFPDSPGLVAPSFIWQTHDECPHFPRISKFLDFWEVEIDGALDKVCIAHVPLVSTAQYKQLRFEGRLN